MVKEEVDKNKEPTDKAEDRAETILGFVKYVFELFSRQNEINIKILSRQNNFSDFILEQGKMMLENGKFISNQYESIHEHGKFITIVTKAIMELEGKNKILEKEVNLLRKELDQLKSQGK
jgi:hypothetical protein